MSQEFPRKVHIREVGPREGFQSFQTVVPTSAKLDLVDRLSKSGLHEIEVTSFVRPDRVPQLADAEALVQGLQVRPGVHYTALYLNPTGFKRSVAASALLTRGWLYTSASATFLKANSNTTIEESITKIPEWCSLFRENSVVPYGLMVSNAFGCAYEGPVAAQSVKNLVIRYKDALEQMGQSLQEVCLADTVGMATPISIEASVSALRPLGIELSLHLHDTRGLGLVNAYTGLRLGISTFESSVGGVGGCPFTPGAAGNIATEDLVYLCHSLGVETGVDVAVVAQAAHLCSSIMGVSLPGKVYKTYPA